MASTDLRFKIGKKVYDTSRIDEVSLRDVMLFNSQAEAMGLPQRWADIERITMELAETDQASAEAHPDAMVMFGVTVWACRRLAGENVTLDEATDIPMSSIEVLEAKKAPKDHQAKGAKKRAPRKASAPAAAPLEVVDSTTTLPTSTPQSESA